MQSVALEHETDTNPAEFPTSGLGMTVHRRVPAPAIVTPAAPATTSAAANPSRSRQPRSRAKERNVAWIKAMLRRADHLDAMEKTCESCGTPRGADAWCHLCLEPYDRPAAPAPIEGFEPRPPALRHRYSRVRAGPTSFGAVGRMLLSALPVAVVFFAIRNVMRSRGDATVAYYLVLGVPAVVLAGAFLAVVWRRERMS